jgi:hypothetical protein
MLRKVLREPLPNNPSPALSKAYVSAQTVLDAAKPKIAGLTVSVSVPPGVELRLLIDGVVVASSLVDNELPADPGEHVVEASAPGFLKATARVTLASADKKTVTLKLEADPNAPVPVPVGVEANPSPAAPLATSAAVAAPVAPPEAPPKSPSRASAYVFWSLGAVGVGAGTVFGVMAMKGKSDLNGQCPDNSCPPSSSDAVDSAKRNGNISTIAFGIGGASLLLGTVLYFSIGSGSAEPRASGAPARGFAGLSRGRAMIGPGSVQLAADF